MEEFKELSHAYSVLSDPAQRSRYDSMSSTDQRGRSGESMNHDQSQTSGRRGFYAGGVPDLDQCFDMFRDVAMGQTSPIAKYLQEFESDCKEALAEPEKKQSPAPYAVLAKKRWVELALLVVPGLFFARFPGLFMAGLRVAGTAGAFLGSVLLRNDGIRRIMIMSVYRWVGKRIMPTLRNIEKWLDKQEKKK